MMSGILWKEMVRQGMARSRTEVHRMLKAGQISLSLPGGTAFPFAIDCDDLDLPGKTYISTGKHMYRLVSRMSGPGYDQLLCWGEIPVTSPEASDGCIHIQLSELTDDALWEGR